MSRINTGFLSLLASCVLIAVSANAQAAPAGIDTSRPSTAPMMSFKDEKDNIRNLNPANSKLTLVHFWATWCVPCAAELAEVDATQWAYGDKDLKVITISLDGEGGMDKVKDFMRDHKIVHLTPYLDVNMTSYKAAGIKGLPTTLFIDKKGNEIARAEGPIAWNSNEVTDFLNAQVK